jgi:uncharacterized protein YqhQ
MEGVMMRGVSAWAVATRGKDGEIAVETHPVVSWARSPVLRWPVIRGVVALAQSMSIGVKALQISADAQEQEPIPTRTWAFAIVAGLALAVGLFFVIPVLLTSLVKDWLGSAYLFWLVEGGVRTAIFLAYLAALSYQPHLRRLFQYHGAEHKTIAAYEAGLPLTAANAQRFSRLHPRCGTSFMLLVMLVAVFVFAPVGLPAWWILLLTRILGVPLVAGLSFELMRLTTRPAWPGLQLQRLTTREPDAAQLAVAIAALEAVLAVEDPARVPAEERVGVEVVA